MTRIKKFSTMLISALALSALLFGGSAVSAKVPAANAAVTKICSKAVLVNLYVKGTRTVIGNVGAPVASDGDRNCYNRLGDRSGAVTTINDALNGGIYNYWLNFTINMKDPSYYGPSTVYAVKVIQGSNRLAQDG
ncbi:MAG: hypothetical protein LBU05_03375, partial [Bifidobacteriaceae bacterium]|nr:hypothetical protein [Bifidobacteriaceae bacterium]